MSLQRKFMTKRSFVMDHVEYGCNSNDFTYKIKYKDDIYDKTTKQNISFRILNLKINKVDNKTKI